MRSLGPAFKVGLTFIGIAAASYWAFMMLAKGECGRGSDPLTVYAYFSDATLLVEKSRVQIAGLTVGHIAERELVVQPPRPELVRQKRFAKITLALSPDVALYSNAVVYKRSASLLGEFYLEIDPGSPRWLDAQGNVHAAERIRDGGEITNVAEAATTSTVVQQVNDMLPTLKELLQDLQRFTSGPLMSIGNNVNEGLIENRDALRGAIANIEDITHSVRRMTSGADDDVRQILDNLREVSQSVRQLVGEGQTRKDLERGVSTLSEAVEKLDRALGSAEEIASDLQEGKGNLGRLLKDEELIDSVQEVVQDAGSVVKSITGLQTVVGLRSEYNFEAGTIKTYVTIELWPRPDKFYLIELVDDPRGRRDVTTTITRSDDPSQPPLSREDRVVLSDAFRFTFQFAKRLHVWQADTTFRFGIKESTGGVGVDFGLGQGRFMLSGDLFDFAANVYPRLKIAALWEFFRRLYIVGGVDDALNQHPQDGVGGGRDYFLGFQLRFNDEDLRQLLLFGGGALGSAARQ